MARKFEPFCEETIKKEFAALPVPDYHALTKAMATWQKQDDLDSVRPALIKKYGDDIRMLRHENNEFQGRVLFYTRLPVDGVIRDVALVVYKKEGNKVPAHILDAAKRRMKEHRGE